MRVRVLIDTLVLTGVQPGDRHAVATGLQQELARLLDDPALAARLADGGDIDLLRTSSAHLSPGASPAQLGSAAARKIGGRLRSGSLQSGGLRR